jgi:hypothetical protein
MHKGGEARGVRNFTQAELIAEALEEEERNKEELQKWLRREEERRELRRVGRKRVRGPRWTWISRTVGKMVEVVEDDGVGKEVEVRKAKEGPVDDPVDEAGPSTQFDITPSDRTRSESVQAIPNHTQVGQASQTPRATATITTQDSTPTAPTARIVSPVEPPQNAVASSSKLVDPALAAPNLSTTIQTTPTPVQSDPTQYTRNYLILSQIPGGLPAELALVLGNHVEWDQVEYIPARNRPVIRRPPRCPFTGKVAKYRHPATMIPYADVGGYKEIEALLQNRYLWSEGGFWLGGEEDLGAPEAEEIEGWKEACLGGWMGGFPLDLGVDARVEGVEAVEEVFEPVKKGRKRASEAAGGAQVASRGKKRGRKNAF